MPNFYVHPSKQAEFDRLLAWHSSLVRDPTSFPLDPPPTELLRILPSFPLDNDVQQRAFYYEPRNLFECVFRYDPIDFRSDRAGVRTPIDRPRRAGNTAVSPTPLFPLSGGRISRAPGPDSNDTTNLGPLLASHFAKHCPDGVDFVSDPQIVVRLQDACMNRLKDPSESMDAISSEELDAVRSWVAALEHARQVLSETASLGYELEQSTATRIFLAEAINVLMRVESNFKPDQAVGSREKDGVEWTGSKLQKAIGIGDLVCWLRKVPDVPARGSGPYIKALLEFKRLKALLDTYMSQIERAASTNRFTASAHGSQFGFTLRVAEDGKITCEGNPAAEAMGETEKRAVLQMYAQLHANRCIYDILFNTRDALVFKLKNRSTMLVSQMINKHDAVARPAMNIAAVMLGVALIEEEDVQDPSIIFCAFEKEVKEELVKPRLTGDGETRRTSGTSGVGVGPGGVAGLSSMDVDEAGPSRRRGASQSMTSSAITTEQCWDCAALPLDGYSTDQAKFSFTLTVQALEAQGGLWRVYRGLATSTTATSMSLSVNLDPLLYHSSTSSSSHDCTESPYTQNRFKAPTGRVWLKERVSTEDDTDLDTSFNSSSSKSSDPISRVGDNGTYESPPTSASAYPDEMPSHFHAALKFLLPALQGVTTEEAESLARHEIDSCSSALSYLQGVAIPRTYGVWHRPETAHILVAMEWLDEAFETELDWKDLDDVDRRAVARLLRAFYTSGYSHGDLQVRHLKRNSHGQLRIIDFDRCRSGGAFDEAVAIARQLGVRADYLLSGTREEVGNSTGLTGVRHEVPQNGRGEM